MKELSIEEKAKAYDIALNKIKMLLGTGSSCSREELEYVFPELKESEDERIRKHIIQVFRDHFNGEDCDKCITWLEKQGEKKPVDKVELKFREGDWIIGDKDNSVHQVKTAIENVSNGKYAYDLIDGGYISTSHESNYHLWTIQDAKDGDVLAYNDGSLTIFRYRLSGLDAGLYMSYILLTDKIKFKQTCAISNVHPATKEQRDLLFQKMKEAGYEWDAERKELKKIEQKSSWSEEDENRVNRLIAYFEDKESFTAEDDIVYANWLKSIKDRVQPQPKQEWSEEDENVISLILSICNDFLKSFEISPASTKVIKEDVNKIDNWLKSLRPQTTWKPSDEQLQALRWVCNRTFIAQEPQKESVLEDLYEQLKALV